MYVGMCGAIPNRNWAVVMVVIKLILCAIPYKEGYVRMIGCLCGFVYVCVVISIYRWSSWVLSSSVTSVIIIIMIGGIGRFARGGLN